MIKQGGATMDYKETEKLRGVGEVPADDDNVLEQPGDEPEQQDGTPRDERRETPDSGQDAPAGA